MHVILKFLLFYWDTLAIILIPILFSPLILCDDTPAKRCLYVVCVMAVYWMLEVFPLGITGLMPIFLFPMMGLMDSRSTCMCYMKDTNLMFIGGLFMALSIEYCNLHTRIALLTIKLIGCSPRLLNLGLMLVTSVISWWIVNTAVAAMMIPIVQAILEQLESQGFGSMYEPQQFDPSDPDKSLPSLKDDENRKPTKLTMCMFYSTAIAASVGGIATPVGTDTNLAFKGMFEQYYPACPGGIDFLYWLKIGLPMAIIMIFCQIFWVQLFYLGMFRPNSKDAKAINVGKEGEKLAQQVLVEKLRKLGPMSFHEKSVLVIFLLAISLWVFRSPNVFKGWADRLTKVKVQDSFPAIFCCLILLAFPATPSIIDFVRYEGDPEKQPQITSGALVPWRLLHNKMPWGLVFLIGGGLAISDATKRSGMGDMVADWLDFLRFVPREGVLWITVFFATVATNIISSNVAVCNILMPIYSSIAQAIKVHPIYLMMPGTIACSFAFSLPISTPPNAIASDPINMSTYEMIKVGAGASLISAVVCCLLYMSLGRVIDDYGTFPSWAE